MELHAQETWTSGQTSCALEAPPRQAWLNESLGSSLERAQTSADCARHPLNGPEFREESPRQHRGRRRQRPPHHDLKRHRAVGCGHVSLSQANSMMPCFRALPSSRRTRKYTRYLSMNPSIEAKHIQTCFSLKYPNKACLASGEGQTAGSRCEVLLALLSAI